MTAAPVTVILVTMTSKFTVRDIDGRYFGDDTTRVKAERTARAAVRRFSVPMFVCEDERIVTVVDVRDGKTTATKVDL